MYFLAMLKAFHSCKKSCYITFSAFEKSSFILCLVKFQKLKNCMILF